MPKAPAWSGGAALGKRRPTSGVIGARGAWGPPGASAGGCEGGKSTPSRGLVSPPCTALEGEGCAPSCTAGPPKIRPGGGKSKPSSVATLAASLEFLPAGTSTTSAESDAMLMGALGGEARYANWRPAGLLTNRSWGGKSNPSPAGTGKAQMLVVQGGAEPWRPSPATAMSMGAVGGEARCANWCPAGLLKNRSWGGHSDPPPVVAGKVQVLKVQGGVTA